MGTGGGGDTDYEPSSQTNTRPGTKRQLSPFLRVSLGSYGQQHLLRCGATRYGAERSPAEVVPGLLFFGPKQLPIAYHVLVATILGYPAMSIGDRYRKMAAEFAERARDEKSPVL